MDSDSFLEQADDLLQDIADLPSSCRASGRWAQLVEGMSETARATNRVTDKMWETLESIRESVERWN
jgi:hypothetical protein